MAYAAAVTAAYALPDRELLAQCDVERCRAGGPGGQHLARTESAVRIVHRATGLEARCQDHRDRLANQADALARLRLRLALHLRGVADPAWVAAQRRGRQLPLGAGSASYPLVVAAALDALAAAEGQLAPAAQALAVSTTQLARLLADDKEVRVATDLLRAAHGHGPLHS